MNIPNHITLEAFMRMPIGEIAALTAEQLALLQADIEEAQRVAKASRDWLDGALSIRYADQAAITRRDAGKDTGIVRFADGTITIIADLPKKVDWDQSQLAALVERIRTDGENPAQYVDIAIKVPERKYSAWPDGIRASFEPARTVRVGALKVTLKAQGADQ
jgi:hypothetical protein